MAHLLTNERILHVLDVAELNALGEATDADLEDARRAAESDVRPYADYVSLPSAECIAEAVAFSAYCSPDSARSAWSAFSNFSTAFPADSSARENQSKKLRQILLAGGWVDDTTDLKPLAKAIKDIEGRMFAACQDTCRTNLLNTPQCLNCVLRARINEFAHCASEIMAVANGIDCDITYILRTLK